jgi:hypothetical protein
MFVPFRFNIEAVRDEKYVVEALLSIGASSLTASSEALTQRKQFVQEIFRFDKFSKKSIHSLTLK